MRLTPVADSHSLINDGTAVHELVGARIWMLTRGRNAWHSKWVKHYYRQSSFYTTEHEARASAEQMRGPGNVFYLSERPVIALPSDDGMLIVLDRYFRPFSGLRLGADSRTRFVGVPDGYHEPPLSPGDFAGDLVHGFLSHWRWSGRRNLDGLNMFVVPSDFSLDVRTRPALASRESVAQGTRFYLGWRDVPAPTCRSRNWVIRDFASRNR